MPKNSDALLPIGSRLINLLSKYAPVGKYEFSDLQLYRDLGLSGDDIDELFEDIEQEFGISLNNFEKRKYFPEEGAYMALPLHWLGFRTRLHFSNYKAISIDEFIKVVEDKVKNKC